MAEKEKIDLTDLLKGKKGLLPTILSLIVGLALGTALGREVLDTAGVPASCVRTIQHGDAAIEAGTAIADDGKAALNAVTELRFNQAGDLLGNIPDNAALLLERTRRFNKSRTQCNADRE
jgi:hypothetical protein